MEGKRAVGLTRNRILSALAIAVLLWGGFAFGFVSSLQLKSVASSELAHRYRLQTGDAPAAVRAEVLAVLRAFQDGYSRRDPQELDSFMHRLFPENGDILLLGTDAGEWLRGYRAVAEFIKSDWVGWGDVRFDVDASMVCSSADVAWIASVGVVHGQGLDQPLRLTAILTRQDGAWLFRQLHFQREDRDPSPSDVFRPGTYRKLLGLLLRQVGLAR